MSHFVIASPPPANHRMYYDELMGQVKYAARSGVSGYSVAAVAIGASGRAYSGVNLEFPGQAHSQALHAEQFAICLARQNNETAIKELVITAEPCGHCRQFLLEVGVPKLPINYQDETKRWHETSLDKLLPSPFSLASKKVNLLNNLPWELTWFEPPEVAGGEIGKLFKLLGKKYPPPPQAARARTLSAPDPWLKVQEMLLPKLLQAASRSYVPYTQQWSGVAVMLSDGRVFTGSVLESSAFNPTISPLHSALVAMLSEGVDFNKIQHVILLQPVQPKISYDLHTQSLLQSVAPHAGYSVLHAVLG